MTQSLLPCPFCGKENPVLFLPKNKTYHWVIKCVKGCSIQIEGFVSKEDAVRAWNRRPVQDANLEMYLPELCDCGELFPENGKCDFCGARARYLTNFDW